MAPLILWIGRLLIGQFIVRAIVGAGLAFITYTGLSGYVEGFLSNWANAMSGLPSSMVQLLLMAGVGTAIDIIGSAMLSVAAIKLATRAFRLGSAT